jgi:hypothetical protein
MASRYDQPVVTFVSVCRRQSRDDQRKAGVIDLYRGRLAAHPGRAHDDRRHCEVWVRCAKSARGVSGNRDQPIRSCKRKPLTRPERGPHLDADQKYRDLRARHRE